MSMIFAEEWTNKKKIEKYLDEWVVILLRGFFLYVISTECDILGTDFKFWRVKKKEMIKKSEELKM